MIRCPRCGVDVPAENACCDQCGAPLAVAAGGPIAPLPPPRSSATVVILIVVALLLVVFVAIAAIIAVPAYVKYARRAKTTEAIDALDRIYKGAAIYYSTPHITSTGVRLPCQFPASQGVTPLEGTCCRRQGGPDRDGDDRCDGDPSVWSDTNGVWASLAFQMTDQHCFVYAFDSRGTLGQARFTASAYADLDCDTIQSTFQRLGFGDPAGADTECAMQGSAAFYVENETE